MRGSQRRAAAIGLLLGWWGLGVRAQDGRNVIDRLLEQAAAPSVLEKNLRVLCDEIGGRMPGTPAMSRAVAWAVEAFRQAGADRVYTQAFSVPNSWAEGESRAEVIAPVRFRVSVAAAGWTPATPDGGLEAEVLDAGEGGEDEMRRVGSAARGKVLLIRSQVVASFHDLATVHRRSIIAMREAQKAAAAGVLFMSTRPLGLLYRHIHGLDGRLDKLPAAVVAREDAQRILRLLEAGNRVRIRLDLPNKTGGPVEAHNVVAEIPGREKPEEVVIIGAHLDSWDLGTGCLDNGCNAALVVELARAIQAVQPRPRRTLRFILFGAEEQGLLGSRAYVEQLGQEIDRVAAVVIHDIGVGRINGYSLGGRQELEAPLAEAMAPVASRGANSHNTQAFYGTDHFDFLLQGIPTLVADQDTTDYVPNYHAASDTFDKVDLTELKNQAAIAVVTLYNIADREQRLGKRLTRAELEILLQQTGLEDQLKFLGLWEEFARGRRGHR